MAVTKAEALTLPGTMCRKNQTGHDRFSHIAIMEAAVGADFVVRSHKQKRPGSMPGRGPPLPGGMLRSAADLHGHHVDFIAM
jgi:hypothetical protein